MAMLLARTLEKHGQVAWDNYQQYVLKDKIQIVDSEYTAQHYKEDSLVRSKRVPAPNREQHPGLNPPGQWLQD